MTQIKPTPVTSLCIEPYKVNEIEPIVIKKDRVYLDCRLKIGIYLDLKELMGNDFKCVYFDYLNRYCDCGRLFNLNGSVKRKVNKLDGVYSQQYICPRCKNTHIAKPENVPIYHCFEESIQDSVILMYSVEHNSLRHMSEIINIWNRTEPSHQTVKNHINKIKDFLNEFKVDNIFYSGNYGYDEQYIYIDGEKYYIFALIDVDQRVLVDFQINKTIDKKTVENFIRETTKNSPKISLTTDGRTMYKQIARKLGFKHNLCIFHLMKNFSETFNDEIKKLNLDKIEDMQIFDYGIIIKDLLYSKNYEKALKRLKYLWNEKNNMPEPFQKFLKKLKKNFNSYMGHLKNKKLASTNNAIENFFGVVFPDKLKKLFKTIDGVEIFLTLHIKRWNERVMNNAVEFGKKYQNFKQAQKLFQTKTSIM